MDDLGLPIAYLVLKDRTPVFDRHQERVGVVEHVLAEEDLDIFHGLIIRTLPWRGRHLFADADQVAELYERGVLLSAGRDELHEPGGRTGAGDQRDGRAENPVQEKLRRAWNWINEHV